MKLFTAIVGLLFCMNALQAQTTISSLNSGNWTSPSTWDLGRIPQDGDVIVVQPVHTMVMDQSLKLSNVVIRLNGELTVNPHVNALLNTGSVINIMSGGRISRGAQATDASISIGGAVKYRSSKTYNASWGVGVVLGLAYATSTTGSADQGGLGFIFGTLPAIWQDLQLFRTPENFVQMVWVTSHESTSRVFHVERSKDARSWEGIGTIISTGVQSGQVIYSFMDLNPGNGMVYYRIGQEDSDGKLKISPVRSVKIEGSGNHSLSVYPNPTSGPITLPFPAPLDEALPFEVIDIQGHVLKWGKCEKGSARWDTDLSALPSGQYLLRFRNADGSSSTSRVVKF